VEWGLEKVRTAIGDEKPDPADGTKPGTFVDQMPEPLVKTPNAIQLTRPSLVGVTRSSTGTGLTLRDYPIGALTVSHDSECAHGLLYFSVVQPGTFHVRHDAH
jgi:hypothetical protein